MLHALLPSAPDGPGGQQTATKFAQQGVPVLVASVLKLGANPARLVVQLFGGAHMLSAPGFRSSLNIGQRNVQAAELALKAAGLRVHHQVTGGQVGRTVRLSMADGQVVVKTRGQEEQILVRQPFGGL
jgi:chemotaxis protein CheD